MRAQSSFRRASSSSYCPRRRGPCASPSYSMRCASPRGAHRFFWFTAECPAPLAGSIAWEASRTGMTAETQSTPSPRRQRRNRQPRMNAHECQPEGRKIIAHGASRGNAANRESAPEGAAECGATARGSVGLQKRDRYGRERPYGSGSRRVSRNGRRQAHNAQLRQLMPAPSMRLQYSRPFSRSRLCCSRNASRYSRGCSPGTSAMIMGAMSGRPLRASAT